MKLGDFFANAPHARPVNPRPVTFTAIAKGKVLPGGAVNPGGAPVAATITAALVFIGGDAAAARIDARSALAARFPSAILDETDLNIESNYHLLWRILHEWDAGEGKIGSRLFPNVDALRDLIELPEATRLLDAYNAYVKEEHPATIGQDTFRGPGGGGPRVAAPAPR